MPAMPNKLQEHGVFLLFDEINPNTARNVVGWILEANLAANTKSIEHLTMVINSPGGAITSAFSIIDAMRGSAIPVTTIGLGEVSSAGLLIFMSGQKGSRILTPNTTVLSHQWSWGVHGKDHELLATTKQFELITQRIFKHYKKCTGMSEKIIREKLLPPQDIWMSAEEAKQFNLCDKIKDLS
jgi:ATP-dependent Clp protease protease subunit